MWGFLSYGAADPTLRGKADSRPPRDNWATALGGGLGQRGPRDGACWPRCLPERSAWNRCHRRVSATRLALVIPGPDVSLRLRSSSGGRRLPGSRSPSKLARSPLFPPRFSLLSVRFTVFKPCPRAGPRSALSTRRRVLSFHEATWSSELRFSTVERNDVAWLFPSGCLCVCVAGAGGGDI